MFNCYRPDFAHITSMGVWGHAPPERFWILDVLRFILEHSGTFLMQALVIMYMSLNSIIQLHIAFLKGTCKCWISIGCLHYLLLKTTNASVAVSQVIGLVIVQSGLLERSPHNSLFSESSLWETVSRWLVRSGRKMGHNKALAAGHCSLISAVMRAMCVSHPRLGVWCSPRLLIIRI